MNALPPHAGILVVGFGHGEDIRQLLTTLGPGTHQRSCHVVIVDQPRPQVGHDRILASVAAEVNRAWESSGWSVRLVQSRENIGYGRALNLAETLVPVGTAWLIILNPDTQIPEGALTQWLDAGAQAAVSDYGEMRSLGVLAPALNNMNGRVQSSTYDFPSGWSYWRDHSIFAGALKELRKLLPQARTTLGAQKPASTPRQVDWVMGAAMLIPRTAWWRVGGFDPAYFLYAEDTDLCWRLRQLGYEILYDASIELIHRQGSPVGEQRGRQQVALFDGLRLFIRRTQPQGKRITVLACMAADMVVRLVLFGLILALSFGRNSLSRIRLRASALTLMRTLRGQ